MSVLDRNLIMEHLVQLLDEVQALIEDRDALGDVEVPGFRVEISSAWRRRDTCG